MTFLTLSEMSYLFFKPNNNLFKLFVKKSSFALWWVGRNAPTCPETIRNEYSFPVSKWFYHSVFQQNKCWQKYWDPKTDQHRMMLITFRRKKVMWMVILGRMRNKTFPQNCASLVQNVQLSPIKKICTHTLWFYPQIKVLLALLRERIAAWSHHLQRNIF